ncbi:Hypothetical protein NTJ_09554 [Nesidiocoris tenuis]|uniref:3D domain-containing protein n=1 Tax=Nesidiocoris tenuis TaxID=355587 RepID=A0ABN7AX23_9HEMI|nr:Hypothetical protein NTJ_09554 [Nesidiocoris tenuis]
MLFLGPVFIIAAISIVRGNGPENRTIEAETVLTAYYPDPSSEDESETMDAMGNRLHTLQDYLDGRAPYVTVSTDPQLGLPYGAHIKIPELDEHYGLRDRDREGGIRFESRDRGTHLSGSGYSRLDVCVRSEQDSYDLAVNRRAKVYFPLEDKKG